MHTQKSWKYFPCLNSFVFGDSLAKFDEFNSLFRAHVRFLSVGAQEHWYV